MESSRIFIRGLPPNLTAEKGQTVLKKHFSAGGRDVTDVKVIPQRRIGFVGFKTPDEARKAAKYFDRSFLKASKLSVSLAKPIDDPSLQKPKKDHGLVQTPKTETLPAPASDAEPNLKKRKRNEVDESDPKLAEYLQTFQPGKSTANEISEMIESAAGVEQEKPVQGDESDDEYEDIPSRPEKRQMKEAPRDLHPDLGQAQAKPSTEQEGDGGAGLDEAPQEPEDSQPPAAAATDDDWLRSRTNRLLDLLDEDEVPVPQRQPPPPNDSGQKTGGEKVTGEEESGDDHQHGKSGTATEEGPSSTETADEEAALATIRKTSRLFLRNLPFTQDPSTQEEELRTHLERFGEVQEVHVPIAKSGSSKGFALALFANADSAIAAFQSTGAGATFQGRLLHVLPASSRRDEALDEFQISKLPLAKQRLIRKKAEASKGFNWNSLYMSQDAVNTAVANRLGVSKAELLDVHDASAAVKQAVAETSVINETKEYFALHGVDLEAFKSQKRGDDAILVKNIPVTSRDELRTLFEQHGAVLQVLMPPSGTIAVVQFSPGQGKAAFSKLAYCRFKDSVLFLEKGPRDLFKNAPSGADVARDDSKQQPAGVQKLSATDLFDGEGEEEEGETTSVFVKNLSFDTSMASLGAIAKALDGYRSCTIKTKSNPKKPGQVLSLGYGFIAFSSKAAAAAGVSALEGYVLDGHTLSVKLSTKGYDAAEERRREDKAKKGAGQRTKLVVKNLGFEVSKKDLRSLFSNYGQLRSCRIPQSMGGKSRGFGFVDFKTGKEAENAFNALKDTHLLGRRLVVDWAEAEAEDPEEQIKAMEAKVRGQTEKVTRAQLTNRTRKKVQIGGEDGDDLGA